MLNARIYILEGKKFIVHENVLYVPLGEEATDRPELPPATVKKIFAPRRKYTRKAKPAPVTKHKRMGKRMCKNCGKSGHMSKTCPEGKVRAAVEDVLNEGDLAERIREMQGEGKGQLTIMRELRVPLRTVKKHWNEELSTGPTGEIEEDASGVGEEEEEVAP